MTSFNLNRQSVWPVLLFGLLSWFATAILAAETPADPFVVRYTLPQAAQVSLALYNNAGQQIRTLLNAVQQPAGQQTVSWDGLDQEGQPAAAGEYHWKLIHGPGIKAEYLFALGTNFPHQHWIAQHGGPNVLTTDSEGIMVAGSPEGSPMLGKVRFNGDFDWVAPSVEPAQHASDLAVLGNELLMLHTNGKLFRYDRATGKRDRGVVSIGLPLPEPLHIPLTDDQERTLTVDVPNGPYLLRVTPGDEQEFSVPVTLTAEDRTAEIQAANPGQYPAQILPDVFRHPSPVTVKDGQLSLTFRPKVAGKWAIKSLQLIAVPTRLVAREQAVAALFPGAVAWLDPTTLAIVDTVPLFTAEERNDKFYRETMVDFDLTDAHTAVVIKGKQLVTVGRDSPKIETLEANLIAPHRIAIDPTNGDLLIAELGKLQQIIRLNRQGAQLAAYGRAGGRKAGIYHGEDFLAVADLACDHQGGFVIAEAFSAPRRTAHFDHDGKLLNEWYGGQQFYTAAVPEPDHPEFVWMDSQWGWLMQVEADYTKRTWKVRACYPWAQQLDGWWVSTNKMTRHMQPLRKDLDGDGQSELYLWSDAHAGLLLKVDETAGRLQPVAMLGDNQGRQDETAQTPVEKLPVLWRDALELVRPGLSKDRNRARWSPFGWADANGDYQMQAAELRLLPPEARTPAQGLSGGAGCLWLDQELRIWTARPDPKQPAFDVRAPLGKTKTGAPIWDWQSPTIAGPTLPYRDSRGLRVDNEGNIYQLLSGNGDGFAAGLDSSHSHGFGWPGTLTDRTAVVKYGPDRIVLWQVGKHASRGSGLRGTTHLPVRVAGFAKACVGISDYAVNPCHFWTTDGLFVGELLDGRIEDGLPKRFYSWWRGDRNQGDEFDNLAQFQYDLLVGGTLFEYQGDALYIGAGWNNAPVYRVHGLDQLTRIEGVISVQAPVAAVQYNGKGLVGESFAEVALLSKPARRDAAAEELEALLDAPDKADPVLEKPESLEPQGTRIDPSIWFEAGNHQHAWPGGPPRAARWTGKLQPRFSEDYTLAVYTLGGGARLWLNGELVIDQWSRAGKHFAKPIRLRAGSSYNVKLEWQRIDKMPEVHLCWESLSQDLEHIPTLNLSP